MVGAVGTWYIVWPSALRNSGQQQRAWPLQKHLAAHQSTPQRWAPQFCHDVRITGEALHAARRPLAPRGERGPGWQRAGKAVLCAAQRGMRR